MRGNRPTDRAPDNWRQTLDTFRERGLTNNDLAEAGRLALEAHNAGKARDVWSYFCGIAWNMVDETQLFGFAAQRYMYGNETPDPFPRLDLGEMRPPTPSTPSGSVPQARRPPGV